MGDKLDKCRIRFKEDPQTVWKLELIGDCKETLDKIEKMNKGKKLYLKKRIKVLD
jgi:hypothetical protein